MLPREAAARERPRVEGSARLLVLPGASPGGRAVLPLCAARRLGRPGPSRVAGARREGSRALPVSNPPVSASPRWGTPAGKPCPGQAPQNMAAVAHRVVCLDPALRLWGGGSAPSAVQSSYFSFGCPMGYPVVCASPGGSPWMIQW